METSEFIEYKKITFLKNKNKELKEQIAKENNYNLEIMEEIEIKIMNMLIRFQKNKRKEKWEC